MTWRRSVLAALAFAPALSACTADAPATADDTALEHTPVAEMTIRARDNVFYEAPDTIAAGVTNVRLINDGPMFHHVWIVRLEDGRTVNDLLEHFSAGNPPPAWTIDVGGPNTPGAPGDETNAIVDFEPGSYAILCVIDLPDGVPHIMKGMVRELTVVPATAPTAAMPPADVSMVLDDYSFVTDRPIAAGTQTIRVENVAAQPHEVLFVRLEPGRTAHEFLQFVKEPQGPPPGLPIGGTTGLATNRVNQITLDFEPGDYALICFIPDEGDGQPHFVHGMVSQIEVR